MPGLLQLFIRIFEGCTCAFVIAGAAKACYGYGSQAPGTLNGFAGSTMRGWAIWRAV